jgi:hypothetical protein
MRHLQFFGAIGLVGAGIASGNAAFGIVCVGLGVFIMSLAEGRLP